MDHRNETPEMKAQWAKYYEEAISQPRQRSVPENLPVDPNDVAQSFLKHGTELDQVSRMIANAEGRRRSVLRQFERYRTSARRASGRPDVVDVAFTEPARLR
ncbi:hypothetical protein [Microvirga yunnanensis]|uniref:hypothetical protein n=1 Tax=Microvirga yunnanensis TaxID=2953740 RepID=UPI0021C8374F|nr:hypothetical protein [Microvirga sp. HBU65207]